MSDAREDALIAMYRAFNQRDIEGVLLHLAPDVDWPNGYEGGREHGRAAVKAYWQRQWAEIDPHVEPLAVETDPDGKVHVRVHQLVQAKDGTVLDDEKLEHVYEFAGPFVQRMTIVKGAPNDEEEED